VSNLQHPLPIGARLGYRAGKPNHLGEPEKTAKSSLLYKLLTYHSEAILTFHSAVSPEWLQAKWHYLSSGSL
jgi:hypothetical protein